MLDNLFVEIYQAPKSAMQSARSGNSFCWRLRFGVDETRYYEPLMNWLASKDSSRRVQIEHFSFSTKESAIAFVSDNLRLPFVVKESVKRVVKSKSYMDNYPNRIGGLAKK